MLSRTSHLVSRFLVREDGLTPVEYSVVLALVVVFCLAAINSLAQSDSGTFSPPGRALQTGG